MKKLLLLTTAFLLSSASVYAACNPNLPACQCSYPEMKNGIISCSETYCETGTKCMSDGSCCLSDNYCESSEQGKQCCSAEQACDATKGCVEKKADIETLCPEEIGTIVTATSGTFCEAIQPMCFSDSKAWCQKYGMTMVTMKEICPSWDGNLGDGKCPEFVDSSSLGTVWTSTLYDSENAYLVYSTGSVDALTLNTYCSDYDGLYYKHPYIMYALCH